MTLSNGQAASSDQRNQFKVDDSLRGIASGFCAIEMTKSVVPAPDNGGVDQAVNGDVACEEDRNLRIKQAFEAGRAAGHEEMRTELSESEFAHKRLVEAIHGLNSADPEALGILFWQSLELLLKKALGENPINQATLIERCQAVAQLIDQNIENPRLRLCPDDAKIIDDADIDLDIVTDSQLHRGTIKLEHDSGHMLAGTGLIFDEIKDKICSLGGERYVQP